MLYGVWHFSFTVSDLERSIAFYTEVLGLRLIHTQEQSNIYTRTLVGYPDAHLRTAQLAVPGEPRGLSTHDLELVQYVQPAGERGTAEIKDPGQAHLAIGVGDIDAMARHLAAAGVIFISQPVEITHGVNRGGKACYFLDPDRIVLEMVQPPPERLIGVIGAPAPGDRD